MSSFTIAGLYAWAPGVEDMDKWRSWAEGRLSIEDSREVPQLDHMSKVSKRRLSQLSKMVLHVGHELLKTQPVDHMILCSNYGEICQQYKITQHKPYAFAMIVSSQGHKENLYNFSSDIIQGTPFYLHPLKLLKWLLTPSDVPLSVANTGNAIFKLTRGQAIDI
jgi:hypothetical protein